MYHIIHLIGPRACYDEGKRVAETLTYAYAKQENMNVRVARIFNTYGPRMHMNDGRVVSNFILQALQEDVITVGSLTKFVLIFTQSFVGIRYWRTNQIVSIRFRFG